MGDKRSIPRKKVFKNGKITFGGSVIDCTVRNQTVYGALLEVESPLGIPRHFVLDIAVDHLRRKCEVAWMKEKRLGV
ncbi:MAG: PilZ domain-containing protein, partial [Bradyrhizobium sp.]|nr:PilZ domain-containing protein [Bradyrhizobium sp.]